LQQQQPSYARTPVSKLEGTASDTTHTPSGAAYSNAFGNAMHNLFEQVILHRGAAPSYDDQALSAFLEDADLDPQATIDRLRTVLNRFLNSRVWSEVQAAERVHTELPLGRLAPSDTDVPTLHSGIIDLICMKDAGRSSISKATGSYLTTAPFSNAKSESSTRPRSALMWKPGRRARAPIAQ